MAKGSRLAESILRTVLAERFQCQPGQVEVGRFTALGEGLSRRALAAFAKPASFPEGRYVVLLPGTHPASRERDSLRAKEFGLLDHLRTSSLPFQTPAPIGLTSDGGRPVTVLTMIDGLPMDWGPLLSGITEPWEIQARAAAAVHQVDYEPLRSLLPGFSSRREHALDHLKKFDGVPGPEAEEALAWAQAHLPGNEQPCLLHGDLLAQNILLDPTSRDIHGLIDWEEALVGDPAYDLAILTRGIRKPFRDPNGFNKLLTSYCNHGGRLIQKQHVRFHELCLAADWLRYSIEHYHEGGIEPPREARARLTRILGMARAESDQN